MQCIITLCLPLILSVVMIFGLTLSPTWGTQDSRPLLIDDTTSAVGSPPITLQPVVLEVTNDPNLDISAHVSTPTTPIRSTQNDEISLLSLPPEILLTIFRFLSSSEDLCSVGQACKYLQQTSEDNSLWFSFYQRANLLPCLDTPSIPSVQNPHVSSYKHLLISIRILQAALREGIEPDFDLLLSKLSLAFMGKVILYNLKSSVYSLMNNPIKTRKYWNKYVLAHLTSEGFNEAVFSGQNGLDAIPEDQRLNYLRKKEASGDKDAQRWVDQALFQGQLGQNQRSSSERMEELDQRIMAGDQNAILMVVGNVIQGKGLGQESRSPAERFATLDRYARLGSSQANQTIIQAIYDGKLGQDEFSDEERYQNLKRRAEAGDTTAQSYVVQALFQGTLGQSTRNEQVRFDELLSLNYEDAHPFVLQALLYGNLGQGSRQICDRIQQIERMMMKPPASCMQFRPNLIDMIFEGKGLGQEEKSANERFQHLERLANAGIIEAQEKLIEAIYEGKVGQETITEAERFAKLEDMAKSSNIFGEIATKKVIKAITLGHLGQKQKLADERFHKLKSYVDKGLVEEKILLDIIRRGGFTNQESRWLARKELKESSKLSNDLLVSLNRDLAAQGDTEALKWLNQSLYEGTYGQDRQYPISRFNQLHEQALQGDKDAEESVVKAIVSGELGQSGHSPSERFNRLSYWAARGNLNAQQEVVEAISQGLLEQNSRDENERMIQLRHLAAEGNTFAANEIIDILVYGRLSQFCLSAQERFNEIDELSNHGNKKAQQIIVSLLTTGVQGIFINEQEPQWRHEFLGQEQRSIEERFLDLKRRALAGSLFARREVTRAISNGDLGQKKEESTKNLLFWVTLGDKEALQMINWGNIRSNNSESQSYIQNIESFYNLLLLLCSPK